jgi:hypothetical protein
VYKLDVNIGFSLLLITVLISEQRGTSRDLEAGFVDVKFKKGGTLVGKNGELE